MGIIKVIHADSIGVNVSRWRGILSVATLFGAEVLNQLEKRLSVNRYPIFFYEGDLEGTSQLHDDDRLRKWG